ncbi:MAG: hypothetical protein CMH54_04650 [Myxococcales bacterium]|nr:hypothetical protein [Myxococcales bacterium]|tara:strand:- start:563 stop:1024 length:462 start_codon:yes stop_codon:yes gene_type:complete
MNLLITITAFALGCVITGVLIWIFTQPNVAKTDRVESTANKDADGPGIQVERRALSRRLASDVKGHELRLREIENQLETATRSIASPKNAAGEPQLLHALRDVLDSSPVPQDASQQTPADSAVKPREFSQLGEYRDQQSAPARKGQELLNDVV